MKFTSTLVLGSVLLLFGCDKTEHKDVTVPVAMSTQTPVELSEPTNSRGNSSRLYANADVNSDQKFIRTADMKFKVNDVINTTSQIEDVTKRMGGFVTSTMLKSEKDNTTVTAVSADSSLESTYYSVSNSLILRVPDVKLDSTLRVLSTMVNFLDFRIVKADDVHLQLLANRLTQDRASRHAVRLTTAIDTRGKKLAETTGAEEGLLDNQTTADNVKLANLNLDEQINFSTISLQIYERQSVRRELMANNKDISAYQPGLGARISKAFKTGCDLFGSILVVMVQMWWFIILLFAAWLLAARLVPGYKLRKRTAL